MRRLPKVLNSNVLVGTETRDDAGVYQLDAKRALVCTTDFFAPVVDDPFDYGRVAAANALSDVWAMGGKPLVALNLVGFPAKKLPLSILGTILEGGAEVIRESGAVLLGGHSVEDEEPKYGLAVVGEVAPKRLFKNVGAVPGDVLILTKPLGSGIITTAIKRKLVTAKEVREVTEVMASLNKDPAEVLGKFYRSVHAVTDVTGYGLLGHLLEMLEGKGRVRARLNANALPILASARRLLAKGVVPGGTVSNFEAAGRKFRIDKSLGDDRDTPMLVADAQTSGGLLASVSRRAAPKILEALRKVAPDPSWVAVIGTISEGTRRVEIVADDLKAATV